MPSSPVNPYKKYKERKRQDYDPKPSDNSKMYSEGDQEELSKYLGSGMLDKAAKAKAKRKKMLDDM